MYNYSVKVRTKAYLWGSSGVTADFDVPLLLIVHNDAFGDPVAISSEVSSGNTALATLQPGECWTLDLSGLRGVYATCDTDSTVNCMVIVPPSSAA
jgi:hypothetical protein